MGRIIEIAKGKYRIIADLGYKGGKQQSIGRKMIFDQNRKEK